MFGKFLIFNIILIILYVIIIISEIKITMSYFDKIDIWLIEFCISSYCIEFLKLII